MKNIFLVDADDTVLNFHYSAEQAIKWAFEKSQIQWKDEYLDKYKHFNDHLWEKLERKLLSRNELMAQRFPRFLAYLGVEGDGEKINEYYIEHLSNHPVYKDGAEEFLQTLTSLGKVYIVTNGTESIQTKRFDIARLSRYASKIFISQTAGYDKPDLRYTQYVIDQIDGFQKENAIWIGDSLSADIKGANLAGIDSIWYNPCEKRLTGDCKPTYIAQSFLDIFRILQIING